MANMFGGSPQNGYGSSYGMQSSGIPVYNMAYVTDAARLLHFVTYPRYRYLCRIQLSTSAVLTWL